MPSNPIEDYIHKVRDLIKNKSVKEQITAELEGHILDRVDYYTELGYDESSARVRAIEDMGSPDDAALPLNRLHSDIWYKNVQIVISAIVLMILFFLLLFLPCRRYLEHFISTDFLSIAVFAGYFVLLYFARKKGNKTPALLVICSLSFQLAIYFIELGFDRYYFDLSAAYQPIVHFFVTLTTKGFSGYIDSVFSYSNTCITQLMYYLYKFGSVFIFALIFAAASAVYISINRQEHMRSARKIRKVIKIYENCVAVVLCFVFLTMITGTAIAFTEIDAKREESLLQKQAMISYVINADVNMTFEQQLENMEYSGFDTVCAYDDDDSNVERYVCNKNNNVIALSHYDISSSEFYINYEANIGFSSHFIHDNLLSSNNVCSEEDYNFLSRIHEGEYFDSVADSDIWLKAVWVSHDSFSNSLDFLFNFKDDSRVNISVQNGIIHYNSCDAAEESDFDRESAKITDYIVNDNRVKFASVGKPNGEYSCKTVLDSLSANGYDMENTVDSEAISAYEFSSDRFRITMHDFGNKPKYHLHYYVEDIADKSLTTNRELYFSSYEFDDDFKDYLMGISLIGFCENYSYMIHKSAAIISENEYIEPTDTEKAGRHASNLTFVFAVYDNEDNIEQYVLKFVDGYLEQMYNNGYIGNMYTDFDY